MALLLTIPLFVVTLVLAEVSCAQPDPEGPHVLTVRKERTGWLGVSVQDMTAELARRMKTKTKDGAIVSTVLENSPASAAGMLDDDIIVEFDGKAISDADDLVRAVRKTKPGTRATVVLVRRDQRTSLQVEIGTSPEARAHAYSFHVPEFRHFRWTGHSGISGASLSDMTRQLAKYFQVPDGRGVLVEEVEEDSPAARAGLLAGDVIVSIGNDRVHDTGDIAWALEDRKEGETVDVSVVRKGATKTLKLEVDRDSARLRFRSEKEIVIPEMPDLDIDIDLEGAEESAHRKALQHSTQELQTRMHELGEKIREKAEQLRLKLQGVHRSVRTL